MQVTSGANSNARPSFRRFSSLTIAGHPSAPSYLRQRCKTFVTLLLTTFIGLSFNAFAENAAECRASDIFSNPHCAEIFRQMFRDQAHQGSTREEQRPSSAQTQTHPQSEASTDTPFTDPARAQSAQQQARSENNSVESDLPAPNLAWVEVADSSMNSVFVEGVDDHPYFNEVAAPRSWQTIQSAWSSGACVNGRLFVTGGGHGDGAHNGILSVDGATGEWRREKEPLVPGPPRGNVEATFQGEPVSKHTYGLLASDDQDLYLLGGAIFERGNIGNGQVNYRYNVSEGTFTPLSDGVRRASGYAIHVSGIIYVVGNKSWGDFWTYTIATDSWESVGAKAVQSGMVANTTVVYEPRNDVFVALGRGHAKKVSRAAFGKEWQNFADNTPEAVLEASYPGVAAHGGHVYFWAGGRTVYRLNPADDTWTTLSPKGSSPGPVAGTGTLHRFNSCGGDIILVNGVDNNMFKLVETASASASDNHSSRAEKIQQAMSANRSTGPNSEPSTSEPNAPAATRSANPPSPKPAAATRENPSARSTTTPAPLDSHGIPLEPPPRPMPDTPWSRVRYEASALTEEELIAAECSQPLSEWTVFDIRTQTDLQGLKQNIGPRGNALVLVHYPENPDWKGVHDFRRIDVRGTGCVKIQGVNDPITGKRPTVRAINAGESNRRQQERYGGLIIENMRVSMGDHHDIHGPSGGGDCILWPNAAQFGVIRNTEVSKCGHHAFITAHAYQQYLEIDNSHFEFAASHLAYIDRVGFAYIHNSTFQSPGWGHALRCLAAKCVINNVHVSNIQLDGTVAPEEINPKQPNRTYIGMNPIDLYMTGGEHILKNSTIDFYNPGRGGAWAAQYRARREIMSSDLGEHDGKNWTYAPHWTQEWFDVQGEPVKPVDLTVSDNTFNCLNDTCYMFLVNSTYPRVTTRTRREIRQWLNENKWPDWETLMAHAPEKWLWTFSRVRNSHKQRFLEGTTYGNLPARIPETPEWVERGLLIIENNNTINNPKSSLIRPERPSRGYCWGFWVKGKEGEECQAAIRQAEIILQE